MIAPTLKRLAVPVGDLTIHPRNDHHQGDVGAISQSLERFGQLRPILVQKSTGYVVAGNHVLLAARGLGWPKIAAAVVDLSDEDALAYLVADNRLPQLGTFDDRGLADLLGDLTRDGGLEGTGYDDEDYGLLLADLARDASGEADDGEVPDLPDAPLSRMGEVYKLGDHRLSCGDATDPETISRLMDGAKAACLWTDPPYGVEYAGVYGGVERRAIANDVAKVLPHLLSGTFAALDPSLIPGAPFYIAHPDNRLALIFHEALRDAGWGVRQTLIWVKDVFVLGRKDYQVQHEPILYGFKPARSGTLGRGGKRWFGDNAQTSVFMVPRPKRSEHHPTMKPVELVRQHLANSLPPTGIVLDPFAGSGSTLLAAHALGRRAYLVDLDPAYCDVIRQRYADLVGDQSFAPN